MSKPIIGILFLIGGMFIILFSQKFALHIDIIQFKRLIFVIIGAYYSIKGYEKCYYEKGAEE